MQIWYKSRLMRLRDYVIKHDRLPSEITDLVYTDTDIDDDEQERLLFLFFQTAQHYEDWGMLAKDGKEGLAGRIEKRPGLRNIIQSVNEEHVVENASEFGHEDEWFRMPLRPQRRDWRKGIKRHGKEDTSPMDVEWTEYDIVLLGKSFEDGSDGPLVA